MSDVLKAIHANSAEVTLGLALLCLALIISHIALSARFKKHTQQWKALLHESNGDRLELLLQDHLRGRLALESDFQVLRQRVDTLDKKMESAKRYTGMVRYDAFADVGGQLSFAFAMYDELGNGIILSSVVGRADCRVFCKEITGGKADRELSKEESGALSMAAQRRAEAVLSG